MIKHIKKWWREFTMSEEERYLHAATDIADLERRMKKLQRGINNFRYMI